MITLIIGGSASGKSEFAENITVKYGKKLLYVATMQPFSSEAKERITKHRLMRKGKGFNSVDCYTDLNNLNFDNTHYDAVLLECMSNLLANEMYSDKPTQDAVKKILYGVSSLNQKIEHLFIVSNDVSFNGDNYSDETLLYIKKLGDINKSLAIIADTVIEVVCSIPIFIKGGNLI